MLTFLKAATYCSLRRWEAEGRGFIPKQFDPRALTPEYYFILSPGQEPYTEIGGTPWVNFFASFLFEGEGK